VQPLEEPKPAAFGAGILLEELGSDLLELGIAKDEEVGIGEVGVRKRRSHQKIRRSLISPSQL